MVSGFCQLLLQRNKKFFLIVSLAHFSFFFFFFFMGMIQREVFGWEVGGGPRTGNPCTPAADPRQRTAKPVQHCKAKQSKNKPKRHVPYSKFYLGYAVLSLFLLVFFFFFSNFHFHSTLLYNTALVLPHPDMNLPRVHTSPQP